MRFGLFRVLLPAFMRAEAQEQLRRFEAALLPWFKEDKDRRKAVERYFRAASRSEAISAESQRAALEELRALSRAERIRFGEVPGEREASQPRSAPKPTA